MVDDQAYSQFINRLRKHLVHVFEEVAETKQCLSDFADDDLRRMSEQTKTPETDCTPGEQHFIREIAFELRRRARTLPNRIS